MKENSRNFDLSLQEVVKDKAGIGNKIVKTSRRAIFNPSNRFVEIASGATLISLGMGGAIAEAVVDQYAWVLPTSFVSLSGVYLAAPLTINRLFCPTLKVKSSDAHEQAVSAISKVYPDWQVNPPSREKIDTLLKKVFYLPPVGGKITKLREGEDQIVNLDPSLTADEQVNNIIKLRQNNELDNVYVHQLTVQGKLPDEFKYAALALVISSPYENDWSKPFFEAEWGRVAPLVHDGGETDIINPLWGSNSNGRTDFLQRVVRVFEPKLEGVENYADSGNVTKFPSQILENAVSESSFCTSCKNWYITE